MAVFTARADVAALRAGGRLLAEALTEVVAAVRVDVTTSALDAIAAPTLRQGGGEPAFLGYHGYPTSLCVSINDEVVHGVPSPTRRLAPGDVVGLDLGVTYRGLVLDMAVTVIVPPADREATRLVKTAHRALAAGLKVIRAGATTGDLGATIQAVVEAQGFGIVRDLVGHGVGRALHEPPVIPNRGHRGEGVPLAAGQALAIEPMITTGDWRVTVDDDGWTVRTRDGSRAAHVEQTVLVTERGCEVLTPYGPRLSH